MRVQPGKVVTVLGAGAALLGGAVLANQALLLNDLPPTLPGAMHDWMWRGWRVRYTKLGQGSPIVLVHGIHAAASSFEMRNIFEPLSQRHTVYALDLLGFGKSERPAAPYSGRFFADLLTDFLIQVVRQPAVVVGSSLSTAYAVAAARQYPELVERLILISPTGATSLNPLGRALGRLLTLPVVGTAAFNLLVARASIQSFLRRVYADTGLVDDPLVDQHWATSHQPNARLAPAAFVAGALDLPLASGAWTPIARQMLVLRGIVRGIGRQAEDAELRSLGSHMTIETLDGVGQLPHDEAPDQVLAIVRSWLSEHARSRAVD